MEDEYRDLYKRFVVDENKRPKLFHYIQEYQWEYNTILANQSLTTWPVPAFAEKNVQSLVPESQQKSDSFSRCHM